MSSTFSLTLLIFHLYGKVLYILKKKFKLQYAFNVQTASKTIHHLRCLKSSKYFVLLKVICCRRYLKKFNPVVPEEYVIPHILSSFVEIQFTNNTKKRIYFVVRTFRKMLFSFTLFSPTYRLKSLALIPFSCLLAYIQVSPLNCIHFYTYCFLF